MDNVRKFRFGTTIQATSRTELLAQVRRVEELGYDSITVVDHVSAPRLAPISTLAAVGAMSSRLRLLSTVFGNDFRHPAFLASEAAAIDIISEGRLELGIGTGWLEPDYAQTGLSFDSPGSRVSRLIEAIHIIKALFADEPVTFSGDYYTIQKLNLQPKPVQRPHPPILIGGGGKRMLTLAAQEADIVSINPVTKGGGMDFLTYRAEVFAEKVGWVREAAGDRFPDLELHSMLFGVVITEDPHAAAMEWLQNVETIFKRPPGLTVEDVLASPYILMGTVPQMVDKLTACRREYGISYFTPGSTIPMETLGPVVQQLTGT